MHLFIATPCYGGLVTQRYMQSVCTLLAHAARRELSVSVELLGYDSLIPRARNALTTTFLDTAGATHLMFIDADIGFTPDQVDRLLAFDEDVVAGMYPLKIIHYDAAVSERMAAGEPMQSAQLRYVGALATGAELQTRDGFATAVYAGTGFMLIRRAVLERMIAAYPDTAYSAAHTAAAPSRSANQYALFDCGIEPVTREYLSEDYAFCHRWRGIGGKLWLDTQSRLIHVGPRDFVGDAGQRNGLISSDAFRTPPQPS